ncbi:MAG: heme-binding protein [Leptolyngbyaceae cyanobacterium]
MAQYEEPKYTLIQSSGNIEVRYYEPILVAETVVDGARSEAANNAFSILANYIFGANTTSTSIAMTAPVTQFQQGEEITMTAPVLQTGEPTRWVVQFIMPAKYTLATLPKPRDTKITIRAIPSKRVAAIQFSGIATEQNTRENEAKLRSYLHEQGLSISDKAVYAYYDGPFTLPILRRNEVMFNLS